MPRRYTHLTLLDKRDCYAVSDFNSSSRFSYASKLFFRLLKKPRRCTYSLFRLTRP